MDLKDRLDDELTDEELAQVPTSFDIVGDIAILKIPDALAHRTAVIADAVLAQHKNVNTVLNKTGERSGEFRTADYELLHGDTTETIHREHGCRFKLDPTTVYFSERLGHERQRVMEQVEDGEVVVDMFAGVGPFSILIARNAAPDHVHAVEKNPDAAAYLHENVELNNVGDTVSTYEGDVADILPALDIAADRIIMNLPKQADRFIDVALDSAAPGATIHYYTFMDKDTLEEPEQAAREIETLFADHGAAVEVIEQEVCGHYNPAVDRVCFDVRVTAKDL